MGRSWVGAVVAISSLCGLFASEALAHPASGIVVNANGEVFFIDTGHGVCKIDARGKLTYIHKVSGGGHFFALDTILKAERPWTPTGVASHDGDVYVLEYTNANDGPDKGWRPRVRKLGRDGKVTTLATVTR